MITREGYIGFRLNGKLMETDGKIIILIATAVPPAVQNIHIRTLPLFLRAVAVQFFYSSQKSTVSSIWSSLCLSPEVVSWVGLVVGSSLVVPRVIFSLVHNFFLFTYFFLSLPLKIILQCLDDLLRFLHTLLAIGLYFFFFLPRSRRLILTSIV